MVNEKLVLRNEPLRRGAGKPHLVEQLTALAVKRFTFAARHPNGSREHEYRAILQRNPERRALGLAE